MVSAVRIATQLDLHRCITKMPHTKLACYERTRLYFLVVLCDHHCSLVYGRPPMTREWQSLKDPRVFMQSRFAKVTDLNVVSQVEFWYNSRRVLEYFGADIESTLTTQRSADLEQLSQAFDTWRESWLHVLAVQDQTDGFNRRTLDLYYHSAKLHLFSHTFRGPSKGQASTEMADLDSGLARRAFESALSLVRCAIEGKDICSRLINLPCYFGTMIAFACLCLIRLAVQGQHVDDKRRTESLDCLRQLVWGLLRAPGDITSASHPLQSLARSLKTAMEPRVSQNQNPFAERSFVDDSEISFDFASFANDTFDWSFPGLEENWMNCPDDFDSSIV